MTRWIANKSLTDLRRIFDDWQQKYKKYLLVQITKLRSK